MAPKIDPKSKKNRGCVADALLKRLSHGFCWKVVLCSLLFGDFSLADNNKDIETIGNTTIIPNSVILKITKI